MTQSTEGFACIFRCHFQPKTVLMRAGDNEGSEAEPQFGVYTFAFKGTMPSPVVAYRNKWSRDWTLMWFYHKVPLNNAMKSHPLVVKEIGPLGEPLVVEVDEKTPEQEALIVMLREVSKVFGTQDIIEEYVA